LQGPPHFTKIGIFGLKTNHLATLQWIATPNEAEAAAVYLAFPERKISIAKNRVA
jgi:hypothetical protein